jgi:dethiobiotin synthetase
MLSVATTKLGINEINSRWEMLQQKQISIRGTLFKQVDVQTVCHVQTGQLPLHE